MVAWDGSTSDPNPVLHGKIHTIVQPKAMLSLADFLRTRG